MRQRLKFGYKDYKAVVMEFWKKERNNCSLFYSENSGWYVGLSPRHLSEETLAKRRNIHYVRDFFWTQANEIGFWRRSISSKKTGDYGYNEMRNIVLEQMCENEAEVA
jgi:hypothetical protein